MWQLCTWKLWIWVMRSVTWHVAQCPAASPGAGISLQLETSISLMQAAPLLLLMMRQPARDGPAQEARLTDSTLQETNFHHRLPSQVDTQLLRQTTSVIPRQCLAPTRVVIWQRDSI